MMKIAFAATNPCHVYDLATALHRTGTLRRYHSGYPAWRLRPPTGFPLATHSLRTVISYGLLRVPSAWRPASHRLFRWQDAGFDRAVARSLDGAEGNGDFLHALPGQALETLRTARRRGWRTVLNHASGPVRQQLAAIESEYRRAGLEPSVHHGFDDAYFAREEQEYAAADFHCVASSVVKAQLQRSGVPADKIWIVPYGANPARFRRPAPGLARDPLRIVFAGQLTQRKGLRVLFDAARRVRESHPIRLDLYGPVSPDIAPDLPARDGESWITLHGAVSQDRLAAIFQRAGMLVLPSWEEAFGLVVPQALNCGLPCLVSDRTGAADLIQPHLNGSVFAAGNVDALASELDWWVRNPSAFVSPLFTWDGPASRLIELTTRASAA